MSISMKVEIKETVSSSIDRINKKLQRLPREAHTFFRAHTPIDSGNARKQTKLDKDTIVADYAYAQRLEKGWSKQAPDGMIKPTDAFIKKRIDEIFKAE